MQEDKKHLMCKLKKSLYGVKQLLRILYQQIDLFFTNDGFYRSQANHSLYIKQSNESLLVVIIYVDDLIIFKSDVSALKWLKSKLEDEFVMSDVKKLYYYL